MRSSDVDLKRRETLQRLARMKQGEFHRLCDIVLPVLYPELTGLVPNGVNDKDRTIKGTPDSYVGRAPEVCDIAVEYNTWSGQLPSKFSKDYADAREGCPLATSIVLVASLELEDVDTSAIQKQAADDGIHVRFIGAGQIAALLDGPRQDLRQSFLGIPIGDHTRSSLIARLAANLSSGVERDNWRPVLDNLVPRDELERSVMGRLVEDTPSWTLVSGGLGTGKSTWAFALASRLASSTPVVWTPAKHLNPAADDSVGELVTRIAYGAASPERLISLGDLLRREATQIVVVLDAIDEVAAYPVLARALRAFRTSALSSSCHVLMLVRSEALVALDPIMMEAIPELADRRSRLHLADMDDRTAASWIQRTGATAAEARTLLGRLPAEFSGRPLYLLKGLALLRAGELRSDAPFAPALVKDFVREVDLRLQHSSPRPSPTRIRRAVGDLAWSCLASGDEAMDILELESTGGFWSHMGENGPLAQAVAAGLLVRLTRDRIGFAHALFQTAFAADRMADESEGAWGSQVSALPENHLRARLLPVASCLPVIDPLVRHLAGVDIALAMECAAQHPHTLSPSLSAVVLPRLEVLLGSRFPSDVRAAVRLMTRLRGSAVSELATTWFNGLADRDREQLHRDVADMCLRLEVPGAFSVILAHRMLIPWDEMTWIEPESAQEIARLSPEFRRQLADIAFEALPTAGGRQARLEILLALLRDDRLTEHLAEKLRAQGLGNREHRLLIYLNTPGAIEVFADSVDGYIGRMAVLREEKTEAAKSEWRSLESEIILKQSDIPMHPHHHLVRLVETALLSEQLERLWFGLEWAGMLGDASLLPAWAQAQVQVGASVFDTARAVETAVLRHGAAAMRRYLHAQAPPQLRQAILGKLALCPGAETERLLLQALEYDDVGLAAVQSLGELRVVAAVPAICARLEWEQGWRLVEVVRVLGEIGHPAAIGPLLRCYRRNLGAPELDDDLGWRIGQALAAIGGPQAVDPLLETSSGRPYEADVLCTALARGDGAGLLVVLRRMRETPELIRQVADELERWDLDRRLPHRRWGPSSVRSQVVEPDVVGLLLAEVQRRGSALGPFEATRNPFRAAGRLDSPVAVAWLRTVASSSPEWRDLDDERGQDAATCAKAVLADLGDEQYVTQLVEKELDYLLQAGMWHTGRLDDWDAALVRRCLVRRITSSTPTPELTWLLCRYADSRDSALLRSLEHSDNKAVADIAHQHIQWEGFVPVT